MDFCTPQPPRRHNPVDSICRKLQTIRWRGDREPNSPFQIPKLSSSSYDSPRCGLRGNLEAVLKGAALRRDEGERGKEMPSSGPSTPLSAPANTTYTVTSTRERRGADGGDSRRVRMWQSHCSTPNPQTKDSPYFALAGGPQSEPADGTGSPPLSRTFTPSNSTFSYNVNFCSADSTASERELPYPTLVVKRLSVGDGGPPGASENRRNMAEISLICEENLLDTIFHACDTQRRGKVYVSHIVDYLRHTTCRSSEDAGLEELCDMLDPGHKDVSIDLDTYHAVMREWIDDRRNNGSSYDFCQTTNNLQEDSVKLRDGVSARRSTLLNMTSGSLEAFGGEASRAELETSELVHCISDLHMNNQKLQEEVKKLKQVVESMEESNQKLAEENEQLHNQARANQQLAQKEKMLEEEVEEMKATLSCTEEGRARASAHSRQMERENQSLIAKIASLQEENFKITMEMDELQKKIKELCDINTELQVQIHSLDAVISEKESVAVEKGRQIHELKAAVEEYSAITELLRKDKNKLETQMQMILPDLAGAGLSLAYRLNQSSVGSLHTELALAQSPLEVTDRSSITPLDETLDKEVLLMLQGPYPEHMALQFQTLFNKLKRDLTEETNSVVSSVKDLLDTQPEDDSDTRLQRVQAELDARRADRAASLDQLAQYTDSLEKELIKMSGNLRRSRTEILHLSVRVQEQENQKRQVCDELDRLKTSQDSREASSEKPASEEEPGVEVDWDEEFSLQDFLKHEQVERNCWGQDEHRDGRPDGKSDKLTDQDEDVEERWTVVGMTGEVRDASTPVSTVSVEIQLEGGRASAACTEPDPEFNSQAAQEEAAVPESAHTQAVSIKHPEAAAPPDSSHSQHNTAEGFCEAAEICSGSAAQTPSPPAEQERTFTPVDSAADMDSPSRATPQPEETSRDESSPSTGDDCREEAGDVEADPSAADMSRHKILSREQTIDKSAAEDSTSLLPVLVEEEESVQDGASDAATVPGTDQLTCSGPSITPEKSAPRPVSSVTRSGQSGGGMSDATFDPSSVQLSEDKKESGLKNKKELTRSLETREKVQEDPSETSGASRRGSETSGISENEDVFKEDRNSLSPSDKEIEAEFQRLALGFKCDMFTLEKRLRLEERSRDLAEENVRREVSSCQGLLQALTPLCEDDSQSMEIIQRLKKNLEILIQSMTRVSSRSEMLGAIHQENRIGKAVEVMIQHVENLRRTYTKEHAELLELREALMQSERSFGSQTEKDYFPGKKPLQNKSARRVSIGPIARSSGNMQFDLAKLQDGSEADAEKLSRRTSWNVAGKSMMRPPLKRFVSSVAWVDTEEPSVMMKGMAAYAHRPTWDDTDGHSEDEQEEPEELGERRKSSLSELGSKLTSLIMPLKTPSSSSTPTPSDPVPPSVTHSQAGSRSAPAAVARGGRGLWLWLALIVVLAGLLALLAHLVMQQPAADAAPVGTGDSWMTVQQLLWPYAGLRHNGQPPV